MYETPNCLYPGCRIARYQHRRIGFNYRRPCYQVTRGGYVIAGLEAKGWDEDRIREVVKATRAQFEWLTIEEARQAYNSSPH